MPDLTRAEREHERGLQAEVKLSTEQKAGIRAAMKGGPLDHKGNHYGIEDFLIQIEEHGLTSPQAMAQVISAASVTPSDAVLKQVASIVNAPAAPAPAMSAELSAGLGDMIAKLKAAPPPKPSGMR